VTTTTVAEPGTSPQAPQRAARSLPGCLPARAAGADWPATRLGRGPAGEQLTRPPFAAGIASRQATRARGLARLLDWLADQPGATWQARWLASGAETADADWAQLPIRWLHDHGQRSQWMRAELASALGAVICADLIRPSLGWLVSSLAGKGALGRDLARARDRAGFARMQELCDGDPGISKAAADRALRRATLILAAKGGTIAGITAGDVLEILDTETGARSAAAHGAVFYRLLHQMGTFGEDAPARLRELRTPGQLTPAGLIDRYNLACRPVRDLLVDYLSERQPALDYKSLKDLAYHLGKRFWQDLEHHHPGIDSLDLPREVADAWKQRQRTRPKTITTAAGEKTVIQVGRISYRQGLTPVRAFYLDLSQWAIEDPGHWAQWVAPCPVSQEEIGQRKFARHRKSRMDARTRERLPVLPVLVRTVDERRKAAAALLEAARKTPPGDIFTAAGQTLARSSAKASTGKIWADDPASGKRRDLGLEEDYAFWAWAAVEVLRLTGIRIEELLEISHHSLIQYRLPSTGEVVPLLQILPSKTDEERLLVVSPELADVLSAIIQRVRQPDGAVPLVPACDRCECVWQPPSPVLFQRRFTTENRAISDGNLRRMLNAALACTGLTDPADGLPLRYTPHDFRRIFITDAVMNGLPPHIAQVIAGHKDINTTMGYKAVYPEEAIQSHLAFLARRRAQRPTDEYRVPSEEEWQEFLGHFERRKVATGICGRAFGAPCIHEHSCLRCSMHWPDPAQRPRIAEIRDNLLARIAEAEREGWLGEVEGLKVSLAGAEDKLAQIDRRTGRDGPVGLGATIPVGPQQEASTRHDH
jgi:integrase